MLKTYLELKSNHQVNQQISEYHCSFALEISESEGRVCSLLYPGGPDCESVAGCPFSLCTISMSNSADSTSQTVRPLIDRQCVITVTNQMIESAFMQWCILKLDLNARLCNCSKFSLS